MNEFLGASCSFCGEVEVIEKLPKMESDRDELLLLALVPNPSDAGVKGAGELGVTFPGVFVMLPLREREDWSASEAACSRRLVVPRAFVVPERAEHTRATLCWSRYSLYY